MNAGSISRKYSRYAFGLLLAVNLLNYIDRQVLFVVFLLIKINLQHSDTAPGFLRSAFMLSYLLLAPLFGRLSAQWGLRSALMVLAGLLCFVCGRYVVQDMEKAEG